MRQPRSWDDEDLLQDEPLSTLFAVHSADLPNRRGRGKTDWFCVTPRADFQKEAGAIQAWLRLAFAASPEEETSVQNTLVLADSPELEIFIDFYWRLYNGDRDEAKRYLLQERKSRGFQYFVDERVWGSGAHARVLLPVGSDSGAHAGSPTHHRGNRRRRPKHLSRNAEDAYDAEVSEGEDDRPTNEVPQHATTRATPDNLHSSFERTVDIPIPDAQLLLSASAQVIGVAYGPSSPLEKQNIGEEQSNKRKAINEQPSSSSHSSSDDIPVSQFAYTASRVVSGVAPMNDARTNEDDPSSLSELTSDESLKEDGPPAEQLVFDVECNANGAGRRRNPGRTASNRQNLTKLMERETLYEAKLKEDFLGTPKSQAPSDAKHEALKNNLREKPQTRSTNRKKAAKKSKVANIGATLSAIIAPPKATNPRKRNAIAPQKPCSAVPSPAADAATSAISVPEQHQSDNVKGRLRNFPSAAVDKVRVTRSSAKKTANKKLKDARPDVPLAGPAQKRRRYRDAEDGGHATRPEEAQMACRGGRGSSCRQQQAGVQLQPPADAVPEHSEPTVGNSAMQSGIPQAGLGSEPEIVASEDVTAPREPPSIARRTRKRLRESLQSADVIQPVTDNSQRLTIRLPRRSSKKAAHVRLPVPLVTKKSNQPQTLDEVDSVIRHAASEALLHHALSTNVEHGSDWEGGAEGEDEHEQELAQVPADKSSDIELVLPLASTVCASNEIHDARPRPPLEILPPIWAQSRQEVCEAFDWFRSYQGGVYFLKDMVKGYLLSAFSSSRDVFHRDGRLIVSHGGGKAESIHTKGGKSTVQEANDQLAEDKSVRALLNTFRLQRPVVLLIDDKYKLFPYDLTAKGYSYVVLGYYHIRHAWAERQPAKNSRGYVVRYKFAFRWCDQQGDPWWIPSQASAICELVLASDDSTATVPPSISVEDEATSRVCSRCNTKSPLVYDGRWMCLTPSCTAFWKTSSGVPPSMGLAYSEKFLELLPCQHEKFDDLRPPVPATKAQNGVTTTRLFCKGWHCVRCGRLSSRYKWEHWECAHCGETYKVIGRFREPKEFWYQKNMESYMHHFVGEDSGIILPHMQFYNHGAGFLPCHHYILPYGRGHIYLILGSSIANRDADAIFREYQEQAVGGELLFRRWPLRSHKCRGTLLTNYFSQNSGEPYQYVGGADNTVAWDKAPSAVHHALELIQGRMLDALDLRSQFNEVLSAAYMEKQRMAFHSDSERGLGPTVAALSLGSAAHMYFRLHSQYDDKPGNGSSRLALKLFLRHGDVVVMQGEGVQKFYEHTVVPLNFRIAATARFIGPENH
ncbi:hypothetical protein SCP_0308700 [Sparassis crispa]|uniref:Fe2OG dioxygenase domain-containing protein n=1 Tax=Sparassis crispa TaxID=139825 RepID=A0A401GG27_9APHY|nr:hypothetical protein SCP_0308700 [Sparassis crispa]GBE81144.1 hypothetical protein SCP_0308700 [Sparassis crispa]